MIYVLGWGSLVSGGGFFCWGSLFFVILWLVVLYLYCSCCVVLIVGVLWVWVVVDFDG